jgi:hypothetical protein
MSIVPHVVASARRLQAPEWHSLGGLRTSLSIVGGNFLALASNCDARNSRVAACQPTKRSAT